MDASVVVPTFNREKILRLCLDCLFRQDFSVDQYEIIIVDDASDDGTESMVREMKSPCRLTYMRNRKRLGPGAARNKAIPRAEGRIVVFIDSDVLVPPWFIGRHVEGHRKNDPILLDGPVIDIRRERDLSTPPFSSARPRLLAWLDFGGEKFITANASVGREDLVCTGGFDEDFVWAWEDVDLGRRLLAAGLRRVKDRRAYALHWKGEPRSLADETALRKERAEFGALFYRKHPSARSARAARMRSAYDKLMERIGWTEKLVRVGVPASSGERIPLWPPFFRKLSLIHAHAEGLKKGLQRSVRTRKKASPAQTL